MLDFKVIELSDKQWIKELLKKSDFRGCEYNFANNMAWQSLYQTRIARFKDFYISCSCKYGMQFTFPAGNGDYKELITKLKMQAESNNARLVINSVTNENLKLFEELFPNQYTVSSDPDSFDYIYSAEKLRSLSGKKYHSKRNHLKKLYENNWEYTAITENDFDDCIAFAAKSYNEKNYDDESSVSEQYAINMFFNHFNELELKGGILRIDGEIQAFTIGSVLNSDTFDVNVEKANADIQGAYAVINNEFAKAETADFTYINREEDLGIEGLRKSKHSYYPEFLLQKNTVTFK